MTTARALDKFLDQGHRLVYGDNYWYYDPFAMLRSLSSKIGDRLPLMLKNCGLGCYNQRAYTFRALMNSDLDLQTCTVDDLEKISGIGPKTSRFFLLHTRENVQVAVIDTHILKFLRERNYPIPLKVTLTPKRYAQYEKWFIGIWMAESDLTLAEFDLKLWNWYAGHSQEKVA